MGMTSRWPTFYDPAAVAQLYVERAARVAEEAASFRREHAITDAREDAYRIAAFGIDCQVAFCTPGASLFVPGAVEDTVRTVEWLYGNLGSITTLVLSLDTHSVHQIFHPAAWADPEGRPPAPFTVITADDVRSGRWRPVLRPPGFPDFKAACIEYCEELEKSGRYVLTVWPYHALLGGTSHALVPALMEAGLFHSLARRQETVFEIKGRSAVTENYSVLAPEVRRLGGKTVGDFNARLFRMLVEHDRVYVFGQAKSHCVRATLQDLLQECRRIDPLLLRKIHVLEDAMSPVPPPPLDPLPEALDFPKVAARALEEFAAAGMRIVRTSDPVEA
jgi:nicotinamidase-related amidase